MVEYPQNQPPAHDSEFLRTQQDYVDRIKAHKLLARIPVLSENNLDMKYVIDNALAVHDLGIAIVVLTPQAGSTNLRNIPKVYFDKAIITASVMENPTINRGELGTQLVCTVVAELIARQCHWWTNDAGKCTYVTNIADQTQEDSQELILRTVVMQTEIGLE